MANSYTSGIVSALIKTIFLLLANCAFFIMANAQDGNEADILKKVSEDIYMLKDISINVAEKSINIPCRVNMEKGLLEVILCKKEGKVHESLLVTEISPLEFQTALLLLGLDPVNEVPENVSEIDPTAQFRSIETEGDSVRLFLSYIKNDETITEPLEDFVYDESKKKELQPSTWLFLGAATHSSGHVLVDADVTIIATYHDPMALMELNALSKYNDELFYVNEAKKLSVGQQVSLIIKSIKN